MFLTRINTITIGAEYGGPDIPNWLMDEQVRINKLLEKHCAVPYNDEVPSIALALRVEGSKKSYGLLRITNVRRYPRYKAIGADIAVRRKDWDTGAATYRRFMWSAVQEAIWVCVGRLKEDGVRVDEERLTKDLACVESEFLMLN